MAVIGITLNEVLRDFVGQLSYTYKKYINSEFEIKEDAVTNHELINHFPFETKEAFNRFIFDEAALEIFGHADQLHNNLFIHFNNFIMNIDDEEEHEIVLLSREVNKSIPSTFFFLTKVLCKAPSIHFVKEYDNIWDGIDIMITATPEVLDSKPEGKTTIKINASYNEDSESDYSFDKITDLINNEELRNEILSDKEKTK